MEPIVPDWNKDEVLALLERRQKITKDKAKKAEASGDKNRMYSHNTALHELWKLEDVIRGKKPEPTDE
jgi:hypothetical protein